MSNDAAQFLDGLFAGVPDSLYFYLWTLPDKTSRWYQAGQRAAAVDQIGQLDRRDVYVGVGLSSRDRGERRRIEAVDAAGIVAMWADVDIAGPAHKKSNLPPDVDAAREVVGSIGAAPTMLVHSGHGLQAWWCFVEPWLFDNPGDRGEAAALANRWNLTLRVRAAERGFTIDATQDLARVMRVPGTHNHKGEPVPVVLLDVDGPRWNPSDLEQFIADDTAMTMLGGRRTYAVGNLQLRADAQPPFELFEALLTNDSKFRQSWDRVRKDLGDDSASSYDLALANIAAACNWTDQQIVDLIISSRRKHGDDLKLRHDYYSRTIARARDDTSRQHASEDIEIVVDQVERAEITGDTNGANHGRKELLDNISSLLGIECTRWVRFVQDPPRYRLETPAGGVTLGEAGVILNQTQMRAAIASATKIVIPRFKNPKWDTLAQAIFKACEDEDTGTESTDSGLAFTWLTEFLQDRPVLEERAEAFVTNSPYRVGDDLYVMGPSLRRWLWMSRGDRVTASRMGEVLRAFGCEHERADATLAGKRTSRSVWRVPNGADEMIGVDAPLVAPDVSQDVPATS